MEGTARIPPGVKTFLTFSVLEHAVLLDGPATARGGVWAGSWAYCGGATGSASSYSTSDPCALLSSLSMIVKTIISTSLAMSLSLRKFLSDVEGLARAWGVQVIRRLGE